MTFLRHRRNIERTAVTHPHGSSGRLRAAGGSSASQTKGHVSQERDRLAFGKHKVVVASAPCPALVGRAGCRPQPVPEVSGHRRPASPAPLVLPGAGGHVSLSAWDGALPNRLQAWSPAGRGASGTWNQQPQSLSPTSPGARPGGGDGLKPYTAAAHNKPARGAGGTAGHKRKPSFTGTERPSELECGNRETMPLFLHAQRSPCDGCRARTPRGERQGRPPSPAHARRRRGRVWGLLRRIRGSPGLSAGGADSPARRGRGGPPVGRGPGPGGGGLPQVPWGRAGGRATARPLLWHWPAVMGWGDVGSAS